MNQYKMLNYRRLLGRTRWTYLRKLLLLWIIVIISTVTFLGILLSNQIIKISNDNQHVEKFTHVLTFY